MTRLFLLVPVAIVLAACSTGNPLEQLLVEENENAIVRVCGEIATGVNPFVDSSVEVNYVEIPANVDVTGVTPEDLENILDCD